MALRVGIVDFAGWFYPAVYAEALAKLEQVQLVSAAFLASDKYMKKVNHLGREHYVKEFGLKPYEAIEAMVQKEKLDAVCMFGEYSRKADHIEVAAGCGVHVFTTKPPATTMDQMRRIVEAGQNNGVSITVPEHTRFNGAIRQVREEVRNGQIGNLICARALHQHGPLQPELLDPEHWYRREENGGPEISLGWYTAGLLEWFIDSEPVRAFAEYDNYMTDWLPFMDNGKGMVRFKDGTIGSMDLYFSTEYPYPTTELELVGQEGSIVLRVNETGWTEYSVYKPSGVTTHRSQQPDSIYEEMRSWVRALTGGGPFEMPAEEALKVLELCIAWKESARTHQPVSLPIEE